MASAMEEAGFENIWFYIQKIQNTVAQYIATQLILHLCERSVWRLVAWVSWRWWYQLGLNLRRSRERAAAVMDSEEDNLGEEAAQEEIMGGR